MPYDYTPTTPPATLPHYEQQVYEDDQIIVTLHNAYSGQTYVWVENISTGEGVSVPQASFRAAMTAALGQLPHFEEAFGHA